MPLTYSTENPDSLQILLKKTRAIAKINKENLEFIESRKEEEVILRHQYRLKMKAKPTKKRKTYNNNANDESTTYKDKCIDGSDDDEDQLWELSNNKLVKPVKDIIDAWEYTGELLTNEKIAFGDFINHELNRYTDLVRLNKNYMDLHEKYSRVLNDQPESLAAVSSLLMNLQIIHVAIGEIHMQILDAKDPVEENELVAYHIKALSRDLMKLKKEIPKIDIDLNVEERDDDDYKVVDFKYLKALSCKYTLKHASDVNILDMKSFDVDGRQYIACALVNGTITIWHVLSQSISFTLKGHEYDVYTLTLYKQREIQMLASGGLDGTIRLWNLSNNSAVATLSGHANSINSISTYMNDGKIFLVSASQDQTFKIWDLERKLLVTTISNITGTVVTIKTYHLDGIPHLVSGHIGGEIQIWNLNTEMLITTLVKTNKDIWSMAIIKQKSKMMLACGYQNGVIEIWDLDQNICSKVLSSPSQSYKPVISLEFVKEGGILCLLSSHCGGRFKFWNIEENRIIATSIGLHAEMVLTTFEIGGESCLVMQGNSGEIRFWME